LFFSSSLADTMPRIFFWLGQISTHTLNSMIVPSHAPDADRVIRLVEEEEGVEEVPRRAAPPPRARSLTLPRNQNKARGMTCFEMPAAVPSAAAALAAATLTKLK